MIGLQPGSFYCSDYYPDNYPLACIGIRKWGQGGWQAGLGDGFMLVRSE